MCKHTMNRFVIAIIMSSLLFVQLPAFAQPPLKVMLNGEYLEFDVQPTITNGRMLVPMRTIFEALGAEIEWNGNTRTVWAMKDETVVAVTIGSSTMLLNGESIPLDAPADLINGRTLVPVRVISESFGADVGWDAPTRIASIQLSGSQDSASSTTIRSKEQIQFMWEVLSPSFSGNPYVSLPSISSPFRAGELHPDFIDDGVKMTNFIRYLTGLPADLTATTSLNNQAQHGSVLLSAHGVLTHYPEQPDGMSSSFYNTGYTSTTSSNLAYYGYSSTGPVDELVTSIKPDNEWTLAASVIHYMQDEDNVNLESVGHRRWILNPQLKDIGFGYSHELSSDNRWNQFERYSVMQIFDDSRAEKVDYDYVAWPSEGYFPLQLFSYSERANNSEPWSVSLNPDKYEEPNIRNITVTLTRISDQKSWVLDQSDYRTGDHQEYFNVNNQNIGIPYAIIFRPAHTEEDAYKSGDVYRVNIRGLNNLQSQPVTIQYEVNFFNLD